MAFKNPPPQAYTREILAQAYDWLKEQPRDIKKMASDADKLVSLYLHAKRYKKLSFSKPKEATLNSQNSQSLDSYPVSSQSFKSELKELAEDLRQFDPPSSEKMLNSHNSDTNNHSPLPKVTGTFYSDVGGGAIKNPSPAFAPAFRKEQELNAASQVAHNYSSSSTNPLNMGSMKMTYKEKSLELDSNQTLDQRTQEMLDKTRERFNLSSHQEALRMLVVLGFESLSKAFDK